MNELRITIPSEPDPDDRFYCVGLDGNGNQFMGFVTGAYPGNCYPRSGEDWKQIQRWYTVMHHFDTDGNHLRSDLWCAGTSADDSASVAETAFNRLAEMFSAVASPMKRPISVRPFSLSDGEYLFGLFLESDPEDTADQWVILQPNDVMFHEPFNDGEYSS